MSTNNEPTALQSGWCPPELGESCVAWAPGHAMHPVQRAVVAATPSSWVDAVVDRASVDGWTTLRTLAEDREVRVWHHVSIDDADAGQPVALHGTYHVLAVGSRWFNVLVDE